MTDIKKDKDRPITQTTQPDAGRRKILKGAGAVTAASALSVPMILVPPRANAATELNMIAWYGHANPTWLKSLRPCTTSKSKPSTTLVAITCWH